LTAEHAAFLKTPCNASAALHTITIQKTMLSWHNSACL